MPSSNALNAPEKQVLVGPVEAATIIDALGV